MTENPSAIFERPFGLPGIDTAMVGQVKKMGLISELCNSFPETCNKRFME
jgi:hypothetical protein